MKEVWFKHYFQKSMEEGEINFKLKKELASKLFDHQKAKKPFWTWTKAIFTAPVIAAFALIFLLSSNQETVKQALQPQEALAQAIQNTFNFDSFETTFGLPNDGKFYHRKMTYTNNYPPKYTYSYSEPTKTVINLWTDGKVVRKDVGENSTPEEKEAFTSFLINSKLDLSCALFIFLECTSIEETTNSKIMVEDFEMGYGEPKKVTEEKLISDLSIKPFFNGGKQRDPSYNDPGYILEWSTVQPMSYVHVMSGLRAENFNDNEGVYYEDDLNYTNRFKDGKYWHKLLISKEWDDHTNPDPNTQYFQITNNNPYSAFDEETRLKMLKNPSLTQHSMIYLIDAKNNVHPVSPEAYIEKIKKRNTIGVAFQQIIDKPLRIAIFFLNQGEIKDPIFSKHIEKNNKDAIQLHYKLPKAYFTSMAIELDEQENLFLDLFLTEDMSRFLGYEFVRNGEVLDSLWIEDEILEDSQKKDLLDEEKWREDLADEEKAKAQQQKEWNEWINQGPGG